MNEVLKNYFEDKDPEVLFEKYRREDPFKDIPPALLCSEHIDKYIKETGLIDPYYPDKLKSASYEILFEGDVYYWDEENKEHCDTIKKGDKCNLKKNNIVFVWTKAKFRIPEYIGLRFNLRINLVHSGLLVGTGPLIDPGFKGNLLVPLHNLTANDYILIGGDGFFWVEFTKTTGIGEFPEEKVERQPINYFKEANQNRPIRSSIPSEVQKALTHAAASEKSAEKAKDVAESSKETIRKYTLWGAVALGFTIVAILTSLTSLALMVRSSWVDYKTQLEKATKDLELLNSLKAQIESNRKDIESQQKEIENLKSRINASKR